MIEKGNFTLPGEAGYEELTLELAEKWGADAIRDSDGTVLSDKLVSGDYDIYSTICLIRIDNEWAKANTDKLQQNYLMSNPVVADDSKVKIDLLKGYFRQQMKVNFNNDPKKWWQVFDRTTGKEVDKSYWVFDAEEGTVTINGTEKWHKYTVNFLAYRIWEGISMYNHITNNWGDREHQMPIDPIYPETQEFILEYLKKWLEEHPKTKIVRFTSLFYNFAWFWGDPSIQKFRYGDWGSYEMTVSPRSMELFAKTKGYEMCSEDFVNKGAYCSSHNVPSQKLWDWMDFMNEFVVSFGRKCINLVQESGKVAYMFYDDHWVGTEPYGKRFKDLNFDGLIKCVFNAFEARLCAGVKGVKTKELRLHPYLFPTGLGGEPTFMEGGNPALDAFKFWANIRRGLLREPVDRIGLGGYLHLVQDFPEFVTAIEDIIKEFKTIKQLHAESKPAVEPVKVAILTAWGKLRSWVYVGHFIHGTEIYEITESLAGLPVDVSYISFNDILENGIPEDIDVIINAGKINTAWSGGEHWNDEKVLAAINAWVAEGGGFIGVGEPSATEYSGQYFQLSDMFGVDKETGLTTNNIKIEVEPEKENHFILEDIIGDVDFGEDISNVYALSKNTKVLKSKGKSVQVAVNDFFKGRAVYLSGFKFSSENTRLLLRALFFAANNQDEFGSFISSNVLTESTYFPDSGKMVVVNNSNSVESTEIMDRNNIKQNIKLEPFGFYVLNLNE